MQGAMPGEIRPPAGTPLVVIRLGDLHLLCRGPLPDAPPLLLPFLQGLGNTGDQILRRHAVFPEFLGRLVPGGAVEPHRSGHPLRRPSAALHQLLLPQEGGNHARQHVSAAPLGHARVAAGVDPGPAIRGGRNGPVSLEHQNAVVVSGKGPGRLQAVLDGQGAPGEPGKLPVVGSEHGEGPPPVQYIHMPRQGIYAVGVQHHGNFQILQQRADQLLRLGRSPQAGADEGRVTGAGLLQNFPVPLRQGEGHGRGALHRHDGVDLPGHAQKDQSRPAAHGGGGRQHRRAGIALAPGQEEQLAVVPLVAVGLSPGEVHTAVHGLHREAAGILPAEQQLIGDADAIDPQFPCVLRPVPQVVAGLAQVKVAVTPARTASPSTSPVSAWRPEGMSQDTTRRKLGVSCISRTAQRKSPSTAGTGPPQTGRPPGSRTP